MLDSQQVQCDLQYRLHFVFISYYIKKYIIYQITYKNIIINDTRV